MRFRLIVPTVLIALALPAAAERIRAQVPAQGAPAPSGASSLFSELRWRSIGPNRGGRSQAVAGSTSRPLEYYFGATGGGLWKTTDGGTTWRAVSDPFFKSSSVGAVAVAESNPDVVYVGMGETELRGNIIQGDGVYKTTDGGKTFSHVGLADTQTVSRIRIHPTNPDIVYVAALGHPYGPNADRGVFRSKDGGKTWQKILFRNDRTGAVDLTIDPMNPQTLYGSMWEVFRTPHSLSSGGPGSAIFKSTDGGDTWTEISRNPGLPKGTLGKIGVAVSPADANRVYAIVEAEDGGVFASDDAGATWRRVNDQRNLRQRAFYYSRIYADPKAKDTVYVLNVNMYRSLDGGKTFKVVRTLHGDNHDLWIAANDPQRLIESDDGGAQVSVNGGESWTAQDYPTAQIYHVITTRHVPYRVCGAQQDNSTVCVDSRGSGDDFYAVGGGESGYIASDPRSPDVYFAGSYGGLMTRYDRNTGHFRQVNVWPDNPMGYSAKDMTERFQWTYPIVFAPLDPRVLFTGSQHLWRSTNEGQSWERISPDLTRADPSTLGPSGGPITLDQTGVETYATIFTIAPSRQDARTLWTGSDDGVVQITRDGGRTWENVTPKDLPDFCRISLIEASPHQNGVAYLAANRYQRDDWNVYVYRTQDFGKSWTRITNGVPAGDIARAIREDPTRRGMLYLGTEKGIYVSFDDGAGWQSLSLNLPVTPVHDIAVEDRDLVIATHGRSFFILDNITSLRQFDKETTNEPLHVFAPYNPMRGRDSSLPVDYYLKADADKVTVEILDARGQVIRTFTGTNEAPKPAAAADVPEEFTRPPDPKPSAKAGLHRIAWDLRYPGMTDFPKMIMWAAGTRGPVAPPGPYQVRVSAGGQTRTTGFEIATDPRLPGVTEADLQEAFKLAIDIRDKASQANDTVIRIRSIKDQIEDRIGKAPKNKAAQVTSAGEALARKLSAIEGEIYQVRNQSSQDPLNFPIKLNNKIAALQGVVDADARPTAQSYAVFKDLSGKLDRQLAQLDTLLKTDLAALNKMLQSLKLDPIRTDGPSKPAGTL
jgi:photosystem II stability/assembly factor-like uncharacterized protein